MQIWNMNIENWNTAWEHENKLEHDDLWLCVACLLFEAVGQVYRNASGWNLYVFNFQNLGMNKTEHFLESVRIAPKLEIYEIVVLWNYPICYHATYDLTFVLIKNFLATRD